MALVGRDKILLEDEHSAGHYLFSFIFVVGIAVNFFNFNADILLIVGTQNVSLKHNNKNCYFVSHFFFLLFSIYYILYKQRTTREVSVWLTINLCNIIYTFISIVFLHILLIEHETTLQSSTAYTIEGSIFVINGKKSSQMIKRLKQIMIQRLILVFF